MPYRTVIGLVDVEDAVDDQANRAQDQDREEGADGERARRFILGFSS